MTPEQRTARLRQIKSTHNLRARDIAKLVGRTTATVWHWLSGEHYTIPLHTLTALEVEVEAR